MDRLAHPAGRIASWPRQDGRRILHRMKLKMSFRFIGSLACLLAAGDAVAQAPDWPKAIADNSFLIEEAYNQEQGVVQHISTFFRPPGVARASDYTFTQEWPVGGQRHQFSYTLPYLVRDGAGGLGDVLLNYRYQLRDGQQGTAISPRVSLVLPTRGSLGAGFKGVQLNLPVSRRWSGALVTHFNAGATQLVRGGVSDLRGYNLGASVIGLVTPRLNVLVEAVAVWAEANDGEQIVRERQLVLSPGVRGAIDIGGLQIVPGVALPFTRSEGRTHTGVFAYLSLEHAFKSPGRH